MAEETLPLIRHDGISVGGRRRNNDIPVERRKNNDIPVEQWRNHDISTERMRNNDIPVERRRNHDISAERTRNNDIPVERRRNNDTTTERKRNNVIPVERRIHQASDLQTNVCSVMASLLCCRKMNMASRICLLWFYILLLTSLSGFFIYVRFIIIPSFAVAPTDTRIVNPLFSVFCESVSVWSDGPSFTTSLFREEPYIQPGDSKTLYTWEKRYNFHNDGFQFWQFYFLEGTYTDVKYTSDIGCCAEIVIVSGLSNFDAWIKDKTNDHYEKIVQVCYSGSFDYLSDITGDMFFIVNNKGCDTNIAITIKLYRTSYLQNSFEICSPNSTICTASLELFSKENVVFTLPYFNETEAANIYGKCNPRIYGLMACFIIAPVAVGIVLTIVVCKCFNSNTDRRHP
ncbi:uncharacterized protein LOC128232791 [Mya arenaria]|uniref:uncharacterized protein LOC128232791 n=1 Tax=Mya arenaria TaxID=6604 RepID=UPI0022E00234|nr:uncharacterized protein LOC128232791 [Mya arenaria]